MVVSRTTSSSMVISYHAPLYLMTRTRAVARLETDLSHVTTTAIAYTVASPTAS